MACCSCLTPGLGGNEASVGSCLSSLGFLWGAGCDFDESVLFLLVGTILVVTNLDARTPFLGLGSSGWAVPESLRFVPLFAFRYTREIAKWQMLCAAQPVYFMQALVTDHD